MEDIKRNMTTKLHIFYQKISFKKLTGMSVLNSEETILKEINVAFIIDFYLGE